VAQQHQAATTQLKHFSRQEFACVADAEGAVAQLAKSWRFHQLVAVSVTSQPAKRKRGRPSQAQPAQPLTSGYTLQATLVEDPEAVATQKRRAGRFILATNVLDPQELSDDALLGNTRRNSLPNETSAS
jgi:hypothetical protein